MSLLHEAIVAEKYGLRLTVGQYTFSARVSAERIRELLNR